jgi:hypothetical protein
MNFDESINTLLLTLYVIVVLFGAMAAVGTVADICRGRRPSRGATIFALSTFAGLAVWSLLMAFGVWLLAVPGYDHVRHAGISFYGLVAGFFAAVFMGSRLEKVWPAPRAISAPKPKEPGAGDPLQELLKPLTQVRSEATIVAPLVDTIRTAMDHAPAIRNPLSALANSIGTNAQISALENAKRLADATASTAEAETKGFEAVMRREDSLIEMRVRQQINPELEQNKIETQRERLREDAHRRTVSTERRSKEHWDARRDTIHARNGEEAARKFKKRKFEMYEKRSQARMADVDVDTATANAASRKLGADPDGTAAADTSIDLRLLADTIRQRLLLASAEGEDTTWLSDHLARIEALLPK